MAMPKLIISCDEKFPVFDLEIPLEGQTSNCEVSEEFHKEFLNATIKYLEIQNQLRSIYEHIEQRISSESSGIMFQKSASIDDQRKFDAFNAAQAEIRTILHESYERLSKVSQHSR
jgi:hypothetical protein